MSTPEIWTKRRHYKSLWGDDYTYEIIWIAKHSETDEELVIYKPLYDTAWLENKQFAARPLAMWYEKVNVGGEYVQRFSPINQ